MGGGEFNELGDFDGGLCVGDGVDGDNEENGDDVGEYEGGRDGVDCTTMFLCNSLNSFSNSLNS